MIAKNSIRVEFFAVNCRFFGNNLNVNKADIPNGYPLIFYILSGYNIFK